MSAELLPNIRSRFSDANNIPLAGGKLYSYQAGTTTPQATYSDQAETTPNANPVILDANGEAVIFVTSGLQYKFILEDANGVQLWSQDDVSGVGFSGNVGTGDVVGPSGALNNEMALYSGTTGKVIKRASGTGFVKATAGVISYVVGVDLTSEVTGALPIANGGTGQTTQSAALTALLPDQTSQTGKFLQTDGTSASWVTNNGYLRSGSVVMASPSTGVTVNFSSALPDTSYVVSSLAFTNLVDANPIFLQGIVTSKTVNGFVVIFNTATDSANYTLEYTVNAAV